MSSRNELRALVLSAESADADAVCTIVSEAGMVAGICRNMDELCSGVATGAGAAVIGQEVLSPASFEKLAAVLRGQPAWSDFPLILIAFPTGGWKTEVEDILGPSADQGNFVVVQRPLSTEILATAVRAALRARSRQYELRRSHELLSQSETRFRTLVSASSEVLYRMSPDWSEMRQLSGGHFLTDTKAPNRNWLQDYIPPDDQPLVTATIRKAIRTKSTFELEHRVRRVDGDMGWTSSRAVPVQDANGHIVEWFGAATDITERKRAEEGVRRIAQFPEENPNPVLRVSEGGMLLYANAPARTWLVARGGGMGQRPPADMRALVERAWRERHVYAELDGGAGRTFWFCATQPQGESYVNVYGLEVTERKQAEEAVRESEARERARAAELTALWDATPVAIFISHDRECRKNYREPDGIRVPSFAARQQYVEIGTGAAKAFNVPNSERWARDTAAGSAYASGRFDGGARSKL